MLTACSTNKLPQPRGDLFPINNIHNIQGNT